ASAIMALSDSYTWRACSELAKQKIERNFSEELMHDNWAEIIERTHADIVSSKYQRTLGPMGYLPGNDPLSVILGRTRVRIGRFKQKLGLGKGSRNFASA